MGVLAGEGLYESDGRVQLPRLKFGHLTCLLKFKCFYLQNIDLNALTGWIPERIPIRPKDSAFDAVNVFERLFSHFHQGLKT